MESVASEKWVLCMSGELTGNYGWPRKRKQAWSLELCAGFGERGSGYLWSIHEFSTLNRKSREKHGQTYNQGVSCALNSQHGTRHSGEVRHPR